MSRETDTTMCTHAKSFASCLQSVDACRQVQRWCGEVRGVQGCPGIYVQRCAEGLAHIDTPCGYRRGAAQAAAITQSAMSDGSRMARAI